MGRGLSRRTPGEVPPRGRTRGVRRFLATRIEAKHGREEVFWLSVRPRTAPSQARAQWGRSAKADLVQSSSPITAAGPRRIRTGFPQFQKVTFVKRKMPEAEVTRKAFHERENLILQGFFF